MRKITYTNRNWRHQNISSTEYLAIPSCNFSIGRMIHVSKRYGLLLAIEAPSQSSVIRPLPVAFLWCTASFCSSSATCICVSEFLCPDVSSYHLTGDIDNWVDTDRGAEGCARVVFCIKMCEPCSANGIPRMKVAALTFGLWLHRENVWPVRLLSIDV